MKNNPIKVGSYIVGLLILLFAKGIEPSKQARLPLAHPPVCVMRVAQCAYDVYYRWRVYGGVGPPRACLCVGLTQVFISPLCPSLLLRRRGSATWPSPLRLLM